MTQPVPAVTIGNASDRLEWLLGDSITELIEFLEDPMYDRIIDGRALRKLHEIGLTALMLENHYLTLMHSNPPPVVFNTTDNPWSESPPIGEFAKIMDEADDVAQGREPFAGLDQ